MVVKDEEINKLIERISQHYNTNISNRFVRPALLQLPLEKQTWDLMERLAIRLEQYQEREYDLDELYRQVLAAAKFVAVTRQDMIPALHIRLPKGGANDSDRILRNMAANNFVSNLHVFADLVNDIFIRLVELDKASVTGKQQPLYLSIPGLQDMGNLLIGS